MGHSPTLMHDHDKIAVARVIAQHSAPVGFGPLGSALGKLALKKISETDTKAGAAIRNAQMRARPMR